MGARHMTFQELLRDERVEVDRSRLVSQIQKKLAKEQPVEKIANDLVEDLAVVQQIAKEQE